MVHLPSGSTRDLEGLCVDSMIFYDINKLNVNVGCNLQRWVRLNHESILTKRNRIWVIVSVIFHYFVVFMWTHENDWPCHLISAPPPLLCRFEIYPLRKVNLLSPCSRKEDQSADTLPPSGFVKDQRHLVVAPSETASKDPTHSLKFPRPSLGDWRGGGGVNKKLEWLDVLCGLSLWSLWRKYLVNPYRWYKV